jgi:glucokinase
MATKYIIGIDLGGTNLKIGLLDLECRIVRREILNTRRFTKKERLIQAIIDSVNRIMDDAQLKKTDVLGVGLGLPGPVDFKSGIVHFFPNIPGWKEVKLKNILSKRLKFPVFLDNDAKLMCLAEYKLGSAKGFRNSICLTLGTGVGGGIIIEGKLYRGANNASGEIGHMPINEFGPKCNCGGIACLEAYIGNNRVMKEARALFKRKITLEELSALARIHDKKAKLIWHNFATRLGVALAGAVNLLNLDCIVIGGGVANAGKILFDEVKKIISTRAMSVQAGNVKVFKAKLDNDAGLIGAAILVKENINSPQRGS